MTVQERLDAISHRTLDLTGDHEPDRDTDPGRPEINVWAGLDDDGSHAHVTLALLALWGQPMRFADLHPDEARKLAHLLINMANTVDHVVNGVALDSAGLMQQLRDSQMGEG